jgi:threonine dehydrogenase-like Zn-dependent dehydrogenase
MRAVALREGELYVRDDAPDPVPAFGQVLAKVRACGICGSDLHFAKFGKTMLDLGEQMEGMPDLGTVGAGGGGERQRIDLSQDVWMGHEFAAEVLEVGPDTVGPEPGTIVTSIPVLLSMTGVEPIVYSNSTPGGYGEQLLLSAPMLLEVPNGLDPRHAALTEPMAVGLHAVNRSGIEQGEGAVVLGCGPVGLAVIAALRLKGIEPIVAADFSPARRGLASTMGAHEVVDPRSESAFEAWARVGAGRQLVAFEAVGVPGIIDEALRVAPQRTRICVVGVCMERDAITPFFGIGKELEVRFALGYDPMEFAECLRAIAEGDIDVVPMITGEVGLDGVPAAFEELGNPERHCKILVVPS